MISRSWSRLFRGTLMACLGAAGCASSEGSRDDVTSGGKGTGEDPGPVASSESSVSSTSGSRLKARYLKAADGSTHFLSWFDTKRKEECDFVVDAPGHYRCFPKAAAYAVQGSFADSACTQPIVSITHGLHREEPGLNAGELCPPVAYALVMSSDPYACEPTVTKVYGGLKKHNGELYAKRSNGACELTGTAGAGLWSVGAAIPVDEFVEAKVEQEP